MKKKRVIILLAVGVLALSSLVGCGKSEGEKEKDEIVENLESEIVENEERIADMNQKVLDKNEIKQEIIEKYQELATIYEEYKASTDPQKIIELAEEHNSLYETATNETMERIELDEQNAMMFLGQKVGTAKILEREYKLKANYYKNVKSHTEYSHLNIFYSENDSFLVLLNCKDGYTGDLTEILVMKNDGTECKVDISNYNKCGLYTASKDSLILYADVNGNEHYYEYDITGNTAQLVNSGQGGVAEHYEELYTKIENSNTEQDFIDSLGRIY